jgi:phosphatidylethanolamine-binding protein (PEBP) family uncharacterized protein
VSAAGRSASLLDALRGHVVTEGQLMGTYQRAK